MFLKNKSANPSFQVSLETCGFEPDFLRSSGPGTGPTQPYEYNWKAAWKKSSGSSLENREYYYRDLSH
jgi:hypothetical protein